MAKKKSRDSKKSERKKDTTKESLLEKHSSPAKQKAAKEEPKWMPIVKHLGIYVFLMVAAMLYFKPVAFDGMSLQQHDNQQSMQMLSEYTDYKDNKDYIIRWTNHIFGGMPTSIMINQNKNYCNNYVLAPTRLFKPYNEWVCLFLIMFGCYLGLFLMGVDFITAAGLSLMLGFFTANTLFIGAGHTGKMNVLATVPFVMGAMVYAYRKNLLLGASLFALGISINFCRNHVQISYYMFLALGFMGLCFLIDAIKKQELPKFGKFAVMMIVATLLGIFSNLGMLWPNYQYGDNSTRGTSELTNKEHQEGLPPDYVFGLSIEKMETFALMFPNFYGGTQAKSFFNKEGSATSALAQNPKFQQEIANAAKAGGVDPNQAFQQIVGQYSRQYRGSQTMSGGPIYYGAVVCFLFILSMLLLQGAIKWGIVSSMIFLLMLAWGKHLAFFGDFMYHYFPLYNKFRDTKMTLLVMQPIVILAIGLGFKELMHFDPKKYEGSLVAKMIGGLKQEVSRQGFVVLGGAIALGVCLFALLYSFMGGVSAPTDGDLVKISPSLLAAMQADRAALIQTDVYRAIGFIAVAFVAMFLYAKGLYKMPVAIVAVTIIACFDLNSVNSDYLNDDSYVESDYTTRSEITPTKADLKILEDKTYFRVADYSQGPPSQSARASSFHKSVGGYFAAKPLLYQEFWNGYGMDDRSSALQTRGNLFNMLNVKYYILGPNQAMENPAALGNAWFVTEIETVDDANKELEALNTLAPHQKAIVQKKYAGPIEGLANTPTPSDKIYLKKYHPDTMTYVSETSNDRFAVFSEMYYPPEKGWNVYIDGKLSDPFIKTNFLLRGMRIPKGKHEIVMIFEPQAQLLGGTIGSITSIMILLLVGFFSFKHFTTEEKPEDENNETKETAVVEEV